MRWLFVVFALIAGACLPTQAGVNDQLARYLGHPILTSLASFGVGTAGLLLYIFVLHIQWPTVGVAMQAPWYLWIGGLLGAIVVSATIILAPVLGAATMMGLIVAGQMLTSIFLDHFGLVGYPIHPISFWRAMGAIFLIVGVALIQWF